MNENIHNHIKPEWLGKLPGGGRSGCLTTRCKVWPSSTSTCVREETHVEEGKCYKNQVQFEGE